jgi:hypothetical protein
MRAIICVLVALFAAAVAVPSCFESDPITKMALNTPITLNFGSEPDLITGFSSVNTFRLSLNVPTVYSLGYMTAIPETNWYAASTVTSQITGAYLLDVSSTTSDPATITKNAVNNGVIPPGSINIGTTGFTKLTTSKAPSCTDIFQFSQTDMSALFNVLHNEQIHNGKATYRGVLYFAIQETLPLFNSTNGRGPLADYRDLIYTLPFLIALNPNVTGTSTTGGLNVHENPLVESMVISEVVANAGLRSTNGQATVTVKVLTRVQYPYKLTLYDIGAITYSSAGANNQQWTISNIGAMFPDCVYTTKLGTTVELCSQTFTLQFASVANTECQYGDHTEAVQHLVETLFWNITCDYTRVTSVAACPIPNDPLFSAEMDIQVSGLCAETTEVNDLVAELLFFRQAASTVQVADWEAATDFVQKATVYGKMAVKSSLVKPLKATITECRIATSQAVVTIGAQTDGTGVFQIGYTEDALGTAEKAAFFTGGAAGCVSAFSFYLDPTVFTSAIDSYTAYTLECDATVAYQGTLSSGTKLMGMFLQSTTASTTVSADLSMAPATSDVVAEESSAATILGVNQTVFIAAVAAAAVLIALAATAVVLMTRLRSAKTTEAETTGAVELVKA